MIKKIGDKGSPCQTPCVEGKKPAGLPLIITENQALEIHALIHLHQFFEKPILEST